MEIQFAFPDADTLSYHHTVDKTPQPSSFARHCHEFYELIYVTQGAGNYIVEGAQYFISPGTLLLLRPREFHYVEISPDETYERYVFHFQPSALASEARALLEAFDRRPPGEGNFYIESDLPPEFSLMLKQFDSVCGLPEDAGILFSRLRLSELMLMLTQCRSQPGERTDDQLGARVLRYLNENLRSQISLDELARKFFVSKYYLCRAFKKQNGISVHGYLNRKRVMLAKQLIDSGETAAGAAYRVGFGDYSSFFRAYKKMIGRAPSEK